MHTKRHVVPPRTGRLPGVLLAAVFVVIAACASPAKFQPASGAQSFPPYEGEVKVLQNLPPSGQYTRVGIVTVEGVLLTKEEEMMRLLKDKAADKGADAVVLQSPMKVTKDPDGSTSRKLAAWAIRLIR